MVIYNLIKRNSCMINKRTDMTALDQQVLLRVLHSDFVSRSINYSLKEDSIHPFSLIQAYTDSCISYGYPIQLTLQKDDSRWVEDASDEIKMITQKMETCLQSYNNYNFKCLPWYDEGKEMEGMFLSYPGFNSKGTNVIGLCSMFTSKRIGESHMNRQLCNVIEVNELNEYMKKLSTGFDYFYVLDRQYQVLSMHSEMIFVNITQGQTLWKNVELGQMTEEERKNFLHSLPPTFYKGQNKLDYEMSYAGPKLNDQYIIGSFNKQGVPFTFIAYKLFVIDNSQEDRQTTYTERNWKRIKTYKNFYTLFTVINDQRLFLEQYKLQSDIDQINFILLWIYLSGSFIVAVYSVHVAFTISQSFVTPLSLLTLLLREFQPKYVSDFSELNATLLPFDAVLNDLFFKEITEIYSAFKHIMLAITFHNKTTLLSSISDGQMLLDWVLACSFFQKIAGTHGTTIIGGHYFLGICYNNLGNIHFNASRYLEACQCYSTSIVHSNYLLDKYSHIDNDSIDVHNKQRIYPLLRQHSQDSQEPSSKQYLLQQSVPYFINEIHSSNEVSQLLEQDNVKPTSQFQKEMLRLIQVCQSNEYEDIFQYNNQNFNQESNQLGDTLFERKYQYIRSQKMFYLSKASSGTHMWKDYVRQLKELLIFGLKLYLPSSSRIIMTLLDISFGYLKMSNFSKARNILGLSLKLFSKMKAAQGFFKPLDLNTIDNNQSYLNLIYKQERQKIQSQSNMQFTTQNIFIQEQRLFQDNERGFQKKESQFLKAIQAMTPMPDSFNLMKCLQYQLCQSLVTPLNQTDRNSTKKIQVKSALKSPISIQNTAFQRCSFMKQNKFSSSLRQKQQLSDRRISFQKGKQLSVSFPHQHLQRQISQTKVLNKFQSDVSQESSITRNRKGDDSSLLSNSNEKELQKCKQNSRHEFSSVAIPSLLEQDEEDNNESKVQLKFNKSNQKQLFNKQVKQSSMNRYSVTSNIQKYIEQSNISSILRGPN